MNEALGDHIFWDLRFALESVLFDKVPNLPLETQDMTEQTVSVTFMTFVFKQIWPFIIAVAIALRMTRVTADVTEWPVEP